MRAALALLALLGALAVPSLAAAHPLGNFTVNRFSRLEVAGHTVYVRYVLDLAEIPTLQAAPIDPDAYASRIAGGLRLTVDGRPARLVPVARRLAHPKGAGGLATTRLEVVLRGPRLASAAHVALRDRNYANRIGWKEIVVGADAPSRSQELRLYPKDELQSPLDVTAVEAELAPGRGSDRPPPLSSAGSPAAPDRTGDGRFVRLVDRDRLSGFGLLIAVGAAVFWGAAHALSPGHGKAIVTAYLVGTRGTVRHAALLGLVTTATHTAGVFALGGATLFLSRWIVPETLYPWIELASGLLVVGVGASVLRARMRHRRAHRHGHGHHHRDLGGDRPAGLRGLLAVGVSGGLLPCPSALVVLLAAISLHRVALGLLLIVAFSLGLALAITGVGLLAVLARRTFARVSLDGGVVALLPAVSAGVIVLAGVVMTARALPEVSL